MALPTFLFPPFPSTLYTYDTLFKGFEPDHPSSYADMLDTEIYRDFIVRGGAACGNYLVAMGRSLHDNGITMAMADELHDKKAVAVLGGHSESRRSEMYAEAARISAKLTAAGFTMVSGGGPGVMEATHLGAAFGADESGHDGLERALERLSAKDVPESVPEDAGNLIGSDGEIDQDIAKELGEFLAPAAKIRLELGHGGGIGIPTWLYGHEPSTPFAAHIAKYFQNSIREDGLLAIATSGAIYMPGSAGTLQEIFQDTTQNYYRTYPTGPGKVGEFSPMIFFGEHWKKDMPLKAMMDALFLSAEAKKMGLDKEYRAKVVFLSDVDKAVTHIESFTPPTSPAVRLFRDTRTA